MTFDSIAALLFQTLCTLALAGVHLGLWRQRRQPFHSTWAWGWFVYALRLVFIGAFMRERQLHWLFLHQVVTLWSGLLLMWAALEFSVQARWRLVYLLAPLAAVAWAAYTVFVMHDMATAGTSSALLLSAVTFATGFVFLQHGRRVPSTGARLLTWAFLLWGLHHLDYPLLRSQGSGLLLGVFMDVTLQVLVAVGTLAMVLGEERSALAQRTAQLEQLSGLLLRAQEEERRRIARELHDEAGQTLTALKIELDLEGRRQASMRVAEVLNQVRNVSELLRPRALDDLGLVPALRALVEDFGKRTHIEVALASDDVTASSTDAGVTLYRVVQEALTNVARHSGAKRAWVELRRQESGLRLTIDDDGHGMGGGSVPHLGMLGMRERVAAAGGQLEVRRSERGGLRVEARLPLGASA